MKAKSTSSDGADRSFVPYLRSLLLEMLIYGPLLLIYFLLVLRFASEPLERLFHEALGTYAMVSLLFIVAQGVLLEMLTSWLLRKFGVRY